MDRAVRYAALVGIAELIPVPVADTWVQNELRRRLVRGEAARVGREVSEDQVRELADALLLDWRRLVSWPIRKLLRKALLPLSVAQAAWSTWRLAAQLRIGSEGRSRVECRSAWAE